MEPSKQELYKQKFKMEELQNELRGEEEDMLKKMTPKERREYFRQEAESAALRAAHGWK
jgi:hypothetical protein